MPEGAPRFILIDHSIRGQGGHYLEYAERVLAAAEAAGLRPVLATNREFEERATMPFPVYPVYEHGVFLASAGASTKASLYRFAQRTGVAWALRGFSNRIKAARAGSTTKATGALDATAASKAASFAADTHTLLSRLSPQEQDLVFVPTLLEAEMLGIARLLAESEAARLPSWHLLFRRNVYRGHEPSYRGQSTPESHRMKAGFDALLPWIRSETRMNYYTDTDELCRQFEHLAGSPGGSRFQRVAIPVDSRLALRQDRVADRTREVAPSRRRPLELVYVGDARSEKGFERLPSIVEDTADLPVHFTIQCYLPETGCEPSIERARTALTRLGRPGDFDPAPPVLGRLP